MKIYVLIANDNVINGVYSSQNKLIADLSTTLANIQIKSIEIWDTDKGFIDYLRINKKTTITIEN